MQATPLGDLRVLDFSRVLAGPLATMLLGDLGADVIKIERPGRGDDTRSWGPPYDASGQATYFQAANRNKRSVALDLSQAGDRETAVALAHEADVLIENFRPGVMDRLGLGFEVLHRDHPRLVYCSITAFGDRTDAAPPGYDLLVQALGGLMSITGEAEMGPQKVGVALVDVVAGLFAGVGLLAALRYAERTGEGQHVRVDLLSSLLAALVNQGSAFTGAGVVASRLGNDHPSIAPYGLFRAADGDLVLAVGNDRQFASLAEAIGNPALVDDPAFATNAARVAHLGRLRERLEQALGARPTAAWIDALTAVGVPAGKVNDVAEAFALAEGFGLAPIVTTEAPTGEPFRTTRNPIDLSATPVRYRTAPPQLGSGEPSFRPRPR